MQYVLDKLPTTFGSLDEAAVKAYDMASRWGGGYELFGNRTETEFRVLPSTQGFRQRLVAGGFRTMATVKPDGGDGLAFAWHDDFADRAIPAAQQAAPKRPGRRIEDLSPELQCLAAESWRVMRCQKAISTGRYTEARLLFRADDRRSTLPEMYFRTLDMAQETGRVELEIVRLRAIMAAAKAAADAGMPATIWLDYLTGRKSPSPELLAAAREELSLSAA